MVKKDYLEVLPDMKEVRKKTGESNYKVVSTFSGAGGSCLGIRLAGFKVLWANEFIPAARKVYKANHPDSLLNKKDIRNIEAKHILNRLDLKKGEIDLLEGSPPCASFSNSGTREKSWGKVKKYSDTKQRVDDLFFEYIRILKGLKPKVFLAENVDGLVHGKAKGYFKNIFKELKKSGYKVRAKVLNAQWLNVPQRRKRLFFIGTREDLNIGPKFPKPKDYFYTIKDALKKLKSSDEFYKLRKGTKTRELYDLSKRFGGDFKKAHKFKYGRISYFNHIRASWNKPVSTITQVRPCIYHPDEPRTFSINELKRLTSVPDDFKLYGTFSKKWERLARMVPPLMMREIARTIRKEMLDKIE